MALGISRKTFRLVAGILLGAWLIAACSLGTAFAEEKSGQGTKDANHFNVIMVVDASGSMSETDPDKLRFEAMKQFSGLLSTSGNKLGSVVFNEKIMSTHDLAPVGDQASKNAITESIAAVNPDGDTNIGLALDTAVNMIEKQGDPSLPSVILLLSDGNTDMPTEEALQESLDKKAQGVQRARGDQIKIYTVCLNANGKAKTSEMKQLSDATSGEFREVKNAKDLSGAFNAFYNLIYGTSTVPLLDGSIPDSGVLETAFSVPAIGVEEVNIIVYGKANSLEVTYQDGSNVPLEQTNGTSFTMLKITQAKPGNYKLITKGVPGDAIEVNLVYNTDLGIEATMEPSDGMLNPEDALLVQARLVANGSAAKAAEQYEGFSAELQVLDTFDAPVDTVPMELANDHFEVRHKLAEGAYKLKVHVQGNGVDRTSDVIGEIAVKADAQTEAEKNNTPPTPVANPVEKTVAIWPFRDNSLKIDLKTLATDAQDEKLTYKVVSSSFNDEDYTVSGDSELTLTNYSISPGAFTVRAADSFGKSCDIEVVVTSHNVALITLIGLGIAIVIGAIIFFVLLRIALSKPFRGDITVESRSGVKSSLPKTVSGRRGRIKLSMFELEPTGLDYSKSYFQATGEPYVLLRTNAPVTCNGVKSKEVRIEDGARVTISVSETSQLIARFDSRMPKGTRSRGRGFGGRRNARPGGGRGPRGGGAPMGPRH